MAKIKWIAAHFAAGTPALVERAFRDLLSPDEATSARIVHRTPAVVDRGALVAEIAMCETLARRFREDHLFSNKVRAALNAVGCTCELQTLWTLHVTDR
jgi:hypothetical protein